MPSDAAVARVIADTRRICELPAPPFAEGPRAELVASLFAEIGTPTRIDAIGNVVAAPTGAEGPGAVVFAAHLDTVFAAGTEITCAESGGRLAAPGVGDNSVAVAAVLHLARHLHDRRLGRPVVLAATVGEEGLGDLRGAKALLEDLDVSAFVAVEGQMLEEIRTAGVGSIRLQLTVRGPGGHPWGDRGTPSAVHALVDLLSGALAEAHAADVVINVGVVAGGTVINAIAGEATALIDLRAEDEGVLRGTAARIEEVLAWAPDGLEVDVQALGRRPAGRIAADHPLLAAARRARETAGLPPAQEGASSTDANAAYGRDIPALTVGVTTGGNAHRLDEYIDLAPIGSGLAALEALADELTG